MKVASSLRSGRLKIAHRFIGGITANMKIIGGITANTKTESVKRTVEVEGNDDEFSRPLHGLGIRGWRGYPALKCWAIFMSPAEAGFGHSCRHDPRAYARGYYLSPLRGWLMLTSEAG